MAVQDQEQLSLAGFEAPARPTDRLFFALYPDAATARQIVEMAGTLRERLGLGARLQEPERLHITLHHLGDHAGMPAPIVAAGRRAAMSLAAAPFDVRFDWAESFAGRVRNRPFVLRGEAGLDAVAAFQRKLGLAMAKAGLARWVEPRFTPHVTLLYDHQVLPAQEIAPVQWRVQSFVLVRSLLGQHRHEVLGRWTLNDG